MDRDLEIVAIKTLRKELDEKLQLVKRLDSCKEVDICIVKLQEAIMWLGMDLKRLNLPDPYPSSKNPETGNKIEPTSDNLKL